MSKRKIVIIPGDGIGPEITAAVIKVIEATGAEITWVEHEAGLAALDKGKDVLPDETLEAIKEHKVALKGPCTTPIGEGFTSVNVKLRKTLDLYAAVRPVRNLPGVITRFRNVDIVIIRENTEGLYSGVENVVSPGVVMSMKVATEKACSRISHWAFEYARHRHRKKITVFHKANIMKLTDGLFIRKSKEASKEYGDIQYEEMIIDAGCMKLVQDPALFDMLLLENLYGDLISDLCAGLVGGLGVVPGANIGDSEAVFEAVHGSAPDIAGKGVANPLALLMSGVMMLNHLADTEGREDFRACAEKIKHAYDGALQEGDRTRDLGGKLGTMEFAEALIKRLK
ncbi:MAG TPA: isocitrate/isopropylmalate dehydrogenase family protein [Thermodesulfobacteriota bacterium]|nr:isocitrate/isopropylmalate dehydrogenase family protein [Thermodesulfobacteriota bacterium]